MGFDELNQPTGDRVDRPNTPVGAAQSPKIVTADRIGALFTNAPFLFVHAFPRTIQHARREDDTRGRCE
jgi:hypothetical protein